MTDQYRCAASTPLLSLLFFLALPSVVNGQQLEQGAEIRVRQTEATEGRSASRVRNRLPWTEATLVRLTPDTLWYSAGGNVQAVPVTEIEVHRGTDQNQKLGGTVVGGLLGGLAGLLVGALTAPEAEYFLEFPPNDCPSGWSTGWCDRGEPARVLEDTSADHIAGSAVVGALVGGVIGRVVGGRVRKWETVDLRGLSVAGGGFGLVVAVSR